MAGRTEQHTEGVPGLMDCENPSSITGPSHGTGESSATMSSFAISAGRPAVLAGTVTYSGAPMSRWSHPTVGSPIPRAQPGGRCQCLTKWKWVRFLS